MHLAHHQGILVVVLQNKGYGMLFIQCDGKISAQLAVPSFQSWSVHLDPPSLLGVNTLVAALIDSNNFGPHA